MRLSSGIRSCQHVPNLMPAPLLLQQLSLLQLLLTVLLYSCIRAFHLLRPFVLLTGASGSLSSNVLLGRVLHLPCCEACCLKEGGKLCSELGYEGLHIWLAIQHLLLSLLCKAGTQISTQLQTAHDRRDKQRLGLEALDRLLRSLEHLHSTCILKTQITSNLEPLLGCECSAQCEALRAKNT